MARPPRRNIPFGPARSAACLAAAWIALILWLLFTARFFASVIVLIVGSVLGGRILTSGLGNEPLARRVIGSYLTVNKLLMFGGVATLVSVVLSRALLDFAFSGTVPEFLDFRGAEPIGVLLLSMCCAGFSSAVVQNAAKMEENRIVLLFRNRFHRSAAEAAKKIAAPNALATAVLLPVCLWVLIVDNDLIPPKLGIIIALFVLTCSVACLMLFWFYLLPRLYVVASRLLWRQIKRGH